MSDGLRRMLLLTVIVLVAGSIYYLDDTKTGISKLAEIMPITAAGDKENTYPPAKEIVSPAGFVNTGGQPVTIGEHIGKSVILVDFLTYSCINCVRVQPYLNAWHEKYKDQGLVIIGIHTPEFEFEKDIRNVSRAMRDMDVKYPVVLDNDYGTWRAYQNRYWPRKYLIDMDGYIVYDHIGEGGYEETERKIQELLHERLERLAIEGDDVAEDIVVPQEVGTTGKIDDWYPRTPEIYFGASRNIDFLANGKGGVRGVQNFIAPLAPMTDSLYLDGRWLIESEHAQGEPGSGIRLRFKAKDIYMVASSETGAELRVYLDGQLIRSVYVKEDDLYRIYEGASWGEHTIEIVVDTGMIKAFTFTFG